MAIRGGEYAVARMIAVLQASLPAELDLIDAEESDGIVLDDVPNPAYFDYETQIQNVEHPLAIVVNLVSTSPVRMFSTTNSPGTYEAMHTITVEVSLKNIENKDPDTLKKRILRYARAIERVIVIKNPTLPLAGVEQVVNVGREDDVTYIFQEQEEGADVRTASIPFRVHTRENL